MRPEGARHSLPLRHTETAYFGDAEKVLAARRATLAAAFADRPERFANRPPRPPVLPATAWINPPMRSPAAVDDQATVTSDETAEHAGDAWNPRQHQRNLDWPHAISDLTDHVIGLVLCDTGTNLELHQAPTARYAGSRFLKENL